MKERFISILRWSERYTKTDMVYLVKNGLWLNLHTIISSAFSFLLSIAFAKYVSKEAFGSYQFLISLASIIGTLSLTGMNAAVTQAVARGFDGVLKKSVSEQLKYSIIPLLAGIGASLYYFLNGDIGLSLPLLVIAVLMPLINTLNTWSAFVSGKKDFKSFFLQSQTVNVLYYIVMMASIVLYPTTTGLVIANFAALTIGNFAMYRYTLRKYKPEASSEEEALEYGKKLSLSSILPLVALHIDNVLVFHFLGATNLAIYAFASNVPEKFMSLIRPISTLALPKMSTRDYDEFRSELIPKLLRFLALALVMSGFYILIAPFVYRLFFPQYIDSIIYSQVYILATAISSVTSLSVSFMFASRSSKIYFFNIANPVVNIALIALGASTLGIWGVIGARIVGNIFSLTFSSYLEARS